MNRIICFLNWNRVHPCCHMVIYWGPSWFVIHARWFLGKAMQTWPRSVGVFGRLINLQMYILAGVMGRQDLPNRALYLSKASIMRFPLGLPAWTDHQSPLWLYLWNNSNGPSWFWHWKTHRSNDIRSDSLKFLKSFKSSSYSQFENELILRFKVSSAELQQLRNEPPWQWKLENSKVIPPILPNKTFQIRYGYARWRRKTKGTF